MHIAKYKQHSGFFNFDNFLDYLSRKLFLAFSYYLNNVNVKTAESIYIEKIIYISIPEIISNKTNAFAYL